ncbi:L,D-transpeptidase [Nocardioides sambongensis]|uniref:L,D-transpeptidase n=1 Tax=Nocardioides sambongensis TaxID=2589074 RepID=UPI00112E3756|nr:L,D-transpeptidase [Nocardioides sambongensis]
MRPRYGRITVFGSAVAVTTLAALGSIGVIPTHAEEPPSSVSAVVGDESGSASQNEAAGEAAGETAGEDDGSVELEGTFAAAEVEPTAPALPADSGTGQRVVFSEGQQRVWLVDPRAKGADEEGVVRSYLASGSVEDNLDPGTYQVFSRSRHAIGIDDSGTMEYFVRFTHGNEGAAIGFHSIPVDDGEPVQTRAQLGTPLSHGCIRQARADAIALWRFAPTGSTVVVTA